MSSGSALRLIILACTATLAGCAAAGAPPHAAGPEEPATATDATKKAARAEPRTIAGWEARIAGHASTLHRLLHSGTTAGVTSPAGPARPSPGKAPRAHHGAAPVAPRAGGGSAASGLSIRCRRICRHVRAICYAARRICQIAARVGGESARAACERNTIRCANARAVTRKNGCGPCGSASRRKQGARRACLR